MHYDSFHGGGSHIVEIYHSVPEPSKYIYLFCSLILFNLYILLGLLLLHFFYDRTRESSFFSLKKKQKKKLDNSRSCPPHHHPPLTSLPQTEAALPPPPPPPPPPSWLTCCETLMPLMSHSSRLVLLMKLRCLCRAETFVRCQVPHSLLVTSLPPSYQSPNHLSVTSLPPLLSVT